MCCMNEAKRQGSGLVLQTINWQFFTITEKAPTSAFTFKTLLRRRQKGHKGRADWLA